jgi:26S proteasome regulatory subunit N2
MMATQY